MNCPKCNYHKSAVVESRPHEGQVFRRRTCNMCNHLFKSVESSFAGPMPNRVRVFKKAEAKLSEFDSSPLKNVWK